MRRSSVAVLTAALAAAVAVAFGVGPSATAHTVKARHLVPADLVPAARAAAPPLAPRVVAVGIPGEDLGTQADAGAVEIRFADGRRQILFPSDYHAGDRFGTATLVLEVDGDAHPDLAVGVPGRDVSGAADAGAVYLYRGSATGFRPWKVLSQGSGGVPGQARAGAAFGSSLSGYGDPSAHLAVGAPGWDAGPARDVGAVALLALTRAEDPQVSGPLLTEDSPGFPDTAEAGDRFGATVSLTAGTFAVGAPGETVAGAKAAGAVFFRDVDDQDNYALVSQDTPDMPGTAEPGDGFGAALRPAAAFLWIGVPGEDVGSAADAGMVNTFGDADEDGVLAEPGPGYTQNSAAIEGAAESGDRFGTALASYRPEEDADYDTVLVGVPGEDLGTIRDAGMVNEVMGTSSYTQNRTAGRSEQGDRFGTTVEAETTFGDVFSRHVVAGAPGEDGGAGALVVVRSRGVSPGAAIWKQVTGAPEAGDGYGGAVAAAFG